MTLQEMQERDRDNLFLSTSDFADDAIYHLPKGISSGRVQITGVFNQDRLQGSNEVDGDGVTPESKSGQRIRYTGLLELSAEITIDDRDQFIIGGQLWGMRRIMTEDAVTKKLLLAKVDKIGTRTPRTAYNP